MGKVDLKKMFALKQAQMESSFEANSVLQHSTDKGDATEEEWLCWFRNFGRKYKAEKATIIDCDGNTSEQIDIVLYDAYYSPLIFENNGKKFIPAESVFAVFEVKQILNDEHISYAQNKIESVRKLKRVSGDVYTLDGRCTAGKKPYEIIGGLLTYKSGWVDKNIIKNFEKSLQGTKELNKINFICCLKAGAFSFEYEIGHSKFSGKDIELLTNIIINGNNENGVLISAYFKLLRMLAKLGNCLAINYNAYGITD